MNAFFHSYNPIYSKAHHSQAGILGWLPHGCPQMVWWKPSSYRYTHMSSHTCDLPTSHPTWEINRLLKQNKCVHKQKYFVLKKKVVFLHLDKNECYFSLDDDTVFLVVGGVRRLITLPLGEGDMGVIGPLEEHLVPLIVQANPEHICWLWCVKCTHRR